jgi:dTDP-4-dehydrorhamnose reductase
MFLSFIHNERNHMRTNKWLITGGSGLLGNALIADLKSRGIEPVAPTHEELDILDFKKLRSNIGAQYDMVVHCAAWTDVKSAEDPENHDAVYALNVDTTRYIAKYCGWLDIPLIFVSSNYVFGGIQLEPYRPGQRCCPINWYGETKRDAEKFVERTKKHLIIRTGWLYGDTRPGKWSKSLVGGAIKFFSDREPTHGIYGFSDRVGTPTYVSDLAAEIVTRGLLMLDPDSTPGPDLVHYTNAGGCSGLDLMRYIASEVGLDPDNVVFPRKAPIPSIYPANGVLDLCDTKMVNGKAVVIPTWEERVKKYVRDITEAYHLCYKGSTGDQTGAEGLGDHPVEEQQ